MSVIYGQCLRGMISCERAGSGSSQGTICDRAIFGDQMLIAADFECRYHSLDTPPVTKYVAVEGNSEIEIEFITDAPGSSEAVVSVQSDLTAQELHYVGLLLKDPWSVNLLDLTDGKADYAVRLPAPGAFVFHKALVFRNRRDKVKAEKDLYYVFFVLDAFPNWRGAIIAALNEYAVSRPAWFKKCLGSLNAIFRTPESDGVKAVLNQRPATAFPNMNDDQFRQYAWSIMADLVEIMESALATAEE